MENLEKNEMVLNFDELNKLDQFEQANVLWEIIEKLGFKDATMEPNDSGYSIELECEELDATEQIKSLIENYIDENGSISQEQIDEFIWDVIGELDNSDELFEEICNNGAFGSYES
jgi:hypothetical protein